MNRMKLARNALALGILFVFAAGGALFAGQQDNPPENNSTMNSNGQTNGNMNSNGRTVSDHSFAKKAAQSDLAEIKLAKLAESKTQNQTVKDFAQKMIADHTEANEKLKDAASQSNIALPATPNHKQQETYDRLSKLSGTQFDRAYARNQVKDHEHDIAQFKKEAQDGQNAQIKRFAQNTLPVLDEHLTLARQMQQTVDHGNSANGNGMSRGYNNGASSNGSMNSGSKGSNGGTNNGGR